MTKKSFYLTLNIINILLYLCKFIMLLLYFITCYFSINSFLPNCLILLFIFFEIFFMYILFAIFEKYFPNSIFNKIKIELKTCNRNKIYALLLAYCYDFIFALFLSIYYCTFEINFINILLYLILLEIYTLGGILIFYLSTFCLWKIEDKIKSFYNKKQLNNKSAK